MKPLLYAAAIIFLVFTAPIWVPIVGVAGLVGTGAAIVAANHEPAQAAQPSEQFVLVIQLVANPMSDGVEWFGPYASLEQCKAAKQEVARKVREHMGHIVGGDCARKAIDINNP